MSMARHGAPHGTTGAGHGYVFKGEPGFADVEDDGSRRASFFPELEEGFSPERRASKNLFNEQTQLKNKASSIKNNLGRNSVEHQNFLRYSGPLYCDEKRIESHEQEQQQLSYSSVLEHRGRIENSHILAGSSGRDLQIWDGIKKKKEEIYPRKNIRNFPPASLEPLTSNVSAQKSASYSSGIPGFVEESEWQNLSSPTKENIKINEVIKPRIKKHKKDRRKKRFSCLKNKTCSDTDEETLAGEDQQPLIKKDCSSHAHSKLGFFGLVAVAYFSVSGGPWGGEEIFKSGGPAVGLQVIFLTAVMWGIPQIQMVAELSNMYPVNGGYAVWVAEALGPFAGFLESYLSWVGGVCDSVLYPVIIYNSVSDWWCGPPANDGPIIMPTESEKFMLGLKAWGWKCLLILLLSLPNFYSTFFAGRLLQVGGVFQVFILVVFVIYTFFFYESYDDDISSRKLHLKHVWEYYDNNDSNNFFYGVMPAWVLPYLTAAPCAFWKLCGWDALGCMAGEIEHLKSNLYWASMLTLFLIVLQYFFVFSAASALSDQHWGVHTGATPCHHGTSSSGGDETLIRAMNNLQGGTWGPLIGIGMLSAMCLANAGQFVAELLEDSHQVQGMAERGNLPKFTKLDYKHEKYQTPWVALFMSLFFFAIAVTQDEKALIAISNIFGGLGSILQIVSFYVLRSSKAKKKRPWKMDNWVFYTLFPLSLPFIFLVLLQSFIELVSAELDESYDFSGFHVRKSQLVIACIALLLVAGSVMAWFNCSTTENKRSEDGEESEDTTSTATPREKSTVSNDSESPKTYAEKMVDKLQIV